MERKLEQVTFTRAALPKALRVAAYARVSTGKDAMLHSLSAQVSYYSNLIQTHPGWQYCGVYADEALTGTKEDRINFMRLLAECRAGNIDRIITKSISRFARNTVTLLQTVRELKQMGVDVFFEEQNIHTMSADGELMLTILASYAQEESLSASENQKWRIRKGFENGQLIGLRFLYGYDITKGEITVNPEQAAIVREVFRRFNDGEALNAVAADLNARDIPSIWGGVWSGARLFDMVCNEKYTGNALLQKIFVNNHLEKKKVDNRGELPQYYAESTHEAIIDVETFEKARERIAAQRKVPKPKTRTAFTGMILCPRCGKNYKRCGTGQKHWWNCPTFVQKGKAYCKSSKIPEDILYRLSAEVLGLNEFDADTFHDKITGIRAEDSRTLVFCFKDGTQTVKRWEYPSRAESWTSAMKAEARCRKAQQPVPERGWHGYFLKANQGMEVTEWQEQ